jgi:phosphate transport system substrate-binding protein
MLKKYLFLVLITMLACSKKEKSTAEESIVKGEITVYVDETLTPIVEDQVLIFESRYENTKITIVSKSEAEVLNLLFEGKAKIAILARNLSKKEQQFFEQKKVFPRQTVFAKDAVAFISNKQSNDSLLDLTAVSNLMLEKPTTINGLVFDNPNSSTVTALKDKLKISKLPSDNIFSNETNAQVIEFVAKNKGMVGVVGLNWLLQNQSEKYLAAGQMKVMAVKDIDKKTYVLPTQNNLAEGTYPLARSLYIINCQSYSGLGMGFASFIAGDVGQRIVLKSGLLPINMPVRKLNIRKEIINDKN